jgi:hypothetical protein
MHRRKKAGSGDRLVIARTVASSNVSFRPELYRDRLNASISPAQDTVPQTVPIGRHDGAGRSHRSMGRGIQIAGGQIDKAGQLQIGESGS